MRRQGESTSESVASLRRDNFTRNLQDLQRAENEIVTAEEDYAGRVEGPLGAGSHLQGHASVQLRGGVYTSNTELHGCRLGKGVSVKRFIHTLGLAEIAQWRKIPKDLRASIREI